MAKVGDLVTVEWLDAHAETGWSEIASTVWAPMIVLSVGWLVVNDDTTVAIVGDLDPEKRMKGDCNRSLVIPRGMVKRIRKVEL